MEQQKISIEGKDQTIKIPAGVDDGSRIKFPDYDIVLDVSKDQDLKEKDLILFQKLKSHFIKPHWEIR